MDPLFALIQSMTPSEKGYFKKYASAQNRMKYIKLFDAISQMKVYNERKLASIKDLSRTKHYLHNAILKMLVLYHEESSPKIVLGNLLNEVEVLTNRGMLQQVRKRIDRILILARSGEWYMPWYEAITYQGKLCDFGIYKSDELDSAELTAEVDLILSHISNLNEFLRLKHKQDVTSNSSVLIRRSEVEKKLTAIKAEALLQHEAKATCIRSKLMFNSINYYNRILLQDFSAALSFAQRYLQLISDPGHDGFREARPQSYFEAYYMLIACLQYLPDPALTEKYLNDFRDVKVNSSWMEAVKFQYYNSYALNFYHENLRKKEFMEVAEESKKKLRLYHGILKTDQKLGIYLALVEGYMKFGRYAEAIDVIEMYRQNPPKDTRYDYQNYLLFFYLICQYETGNLQLVSNLIANTGRFMKRTGEFSEIENLALKVFSAAIEMPDKRSRNAALRDLDAQIKKAVTKMGGGRWQNYITIMSPFIDSLQKGVQYHEWILEMQGKKNVG